MASLRLTYIPRPYHGSEFIVAQDRRWIGIVTKTERGWKVANLDLYYRTKHLAGIKLAAMRGARHAVKP